MGVEVYGRREPEKLYGRIDNNRRQGVSIDKLVTQVEAWGKERKITINGQPMTQAIKTLEEVHELLEAINKGDIFETKDAIGDIVVTLVMQCGLQGITLEECLEQAYDAIKDRKGHLNEVGDFIKDLDRS